MSFYKNLILGVVMTVLVSGIFVNLGYSINFGQIFFIFLISYPWMIGENVYSLWGGFSEEGSVFSLVGIVQIAKHNAVQLFGLSFCQIGEGIAWQIAGISFYQVGGDIAWQATGISFYQNGGNRLGGDIAWQFFGLSFCQIGGDEAEQLIGLSFYQRARRITKHIGSFSVMQRVTPIQ